MCTIYAFPSIFVHAISQPYIWTFVFVHTLVFCLFVSGRYNIGRMHRIPKSCDICHVETGSSQLLTSVRDAFLSVRSITHGDVGYDMSHIYFIVTFIFVEC